MNECTNIYKDMPTAIQFAICECIYNFLALHSYFLKLKTSIKVKKLNRMATIWEDPYM